MMKKKYFVLIIFVLILLSLFFIYFGREEVNVSEVEGVNWGEERVEKLFLDNSLHEFEYDSFGMKGYGFSGKNNFQVVDLKTGRRNSLNEISEIEGVKMGFSSIDLSNNKYFFIGFYGEKNYFYSLNLTNGNILSKNEINFNFELFEYFEGEDLIYGLIKKENKYYFVKYDFYSGEIVFEKKIDNLARISVESSRIVEDNLYFIGYIDNVPYSFFVGEELYMIESIEVFVDDYKFHKFEGEEILFTSNVQTCGALVGFDNKSDSAFIGHFSSRNENLSEEIEKIIQEVDLKNFDLYVIGGMLEMGDSYENILEIYSLIGEFNVVESHHYGKAYTVVIDSKKVEIY